MPALPIISVVASVIGTAYGIYSGQKAASEQKKLAEEQASFQLAQGQREADNIRRRAELTKGTQQAQYAGSGARLDSDVVSETLKNTDTLAQSDINAVLGDAQRSASYSISKGSLASSQATSNAIGGVLSGIGSIGDKIANINANTPKTETTGSIMDRYQATQNSYYIGQAGKSTMDSFNNTANQNIKSIWGG